MNPITAALSIASLLSLIPSCAQRVNRNEVDASNMLINTPSELSELNLQDPEQSKAEISAESIKAEAFGNEFSVPTFRINYKDSDFVQILRCKEEYRSHLDFLITSSADSNRDDRKWVWFDSFGNPTMCKVASRRTSSPNFQDITARNGKFFYIINPCLDASSVGTGRDECSFHLVATDSIEFNGELSVAFVEAAAELSEVEAQYDALMGRLAALTNSLTQRKRVCEKSLQDKAQKNRTDSMRNTLVTVATTGLTGAAFLGARSLLIQRKMIAPQKISSLTISGTLAAVASIALIAQNITQSNPIDHQSCHDLQKIAEEILAIQKSDLLANLQDILITKSQRLSELNTKFEGYDQTIFSEQNKK